MAEVLYECGVLRCVRCSACDSAARRDRLRGVTEAAQCSRCKCLGPLQLACGFITGRPLGSGQLQQRPPAGTECDPLAILVKHTE